MIVDVVGQDSDFCVQEDIHGNKAFDSSIENNNPKQHFSTTIMFTNDYEYKYHAHHALYYQTKVSYQQTTSTNKTQTARSSRPLRQRSSQHIAIKQRCIKSLLSMFIIYTKQSQEKLNFIYLWPIDIEHRWIVKYFYVFFYVKSVSIVKNQLLPNQFIRGNNVDHSQNFDVIVFAFSPWC